MLDEAAGAGVVPEQQLEYQVGWDVAWEQVPAVAGVKGARDQGVSQRSVPAPTGSAPSQGGGVLPAA
eukprot:9190902-Pyramimonas_sp.AAC.1